MMDLLPRVAEASTQLQLSHNLQCYTRNRTMQTQRVTLGFSQFMHSHVDARNVEFVSTLHVVKYIV